MPSFFRDANSARSRELIPNRKNVVIRSKTEPLLSPSSAPFIRFRAESSLFLYPRSSLYPPRSFQIPENSLETRRTFGEEEKISPQNLGSFCRRVHVRTTRSHTRASAPVALITGDCTYTLPLVLHLTLGLARNACRCFVVPPLRSPSPSITTYPRYRPNAAANLN